MAGRPPLGRTVSVPITFPQREKHKELHSGPVDPLWSRGLVALLWSCCGLAVAPLWSCCGLAKQLEQKNCKKLKKTAGTKIAGTKQPEQNTAKTETATAK